MARHQIITSDKATTMSGGKGDDLTKVIYKMSIMRRRNLPGVILLLTLGVFLFSAPVCAEPRERRERLESVNSFQHQQIQKNSFSNRLQQRFESSNSNTNINVDQSNPGGNYPTVSQSALQAVSNTLETGQGQQIQRNSFTERTLRGLSGRNQRINANPAMGNSPVVTSATIEASGPALPNTNINTNALNSAISNLAAKIGAIRGVTASGVGSPNSVASQPLSNNAVIPDQHMGTPNLPEIRHRLPNAPKNLNVERNMRHNRLKVIQNQLAEPVALQSNFDQIGQLQSTNMKFSESDNRMLDKLNRMTENMRTGAPLPAQPAGNGAQSNNPLAPLLPSRHRQPANLPVLPTVPNSAPNQAPGGGNNAGSSSNGQSSSNSHSNNQGAPLAAPLILGLFGHLPFSSKNKAISMIISEVSRRDVNGIGCIRAPRGPNIRQMGECNLAFAHQAVKEENLQLCSGIYNLVLEKLSQIQGRSASFSRQNGLLFSGSKTGIKNRLLRSQNNCGLFYWVG